MFILEECRIDASSVGRLGSDKYNSDRSINAEFESFPLFLAITQNHYDCFKYLYLNHGYFWDQTHLLACIKLIEEINKDKQTERFLKLLLKSKTTTEIFKSLSMDERVDLIKFLDNPELNFASIYHESLLEKPYSWPYLVYKSTQAKHLEEDEIEALSKLVDALKEEDIEVTKNEKRSKTTVVHEMMKSMAKLEKADDEKFGNFRSMTQKLVKNEELQQYKAGDEDGSKILTEIDENEAEGEEDEEEKESDEDTEGEDDEHPSHEEFCQLAENGKLKRIKKVMQSPEFKDILLNIGYEREVTIGEDEYNSELWNPLLFAIHANKLEVAKYFLTECMTNVRLLLMNPEKREEEINEGKLEIEPTDELYGLLIAVNGKNVKMFELVWGSMRLFMTKEHFKICIEHIVDNKWVKGIASFLESHESHELFKSLKYEERDEVMQHLINLAGELEKEDEETSKYMFETLAKSPYCIVFALVKKKNLKEYVEKARENLHESQMNCILLHNEADKYIDELNKNGDDKLSGTLAQYRAFNQTFFSIKISEALIQVNTTKSEDVDVFKADAKLAHLNYHHDLQMDVSKLPNLLKNVNWTFPSVALLVGNSTLFNNLIANYKPMLGLIFKPYSKVMSDDKNGEYASELQALIQYKHDLDLIFNSFSNHAYLFTFQEVYLAVHNSIEFGSIPELKILNSSAVKSWYNFLSAASKTKWVEEMFDLVEEDKDKINALSDILLDFEMFEDVRENRLILFR